MRVADQQAEQEKAAAEQLIATTPRFQGVQEIRVELGDDHDGEPSMWVILQLGPDATRDDAWFRDFSKYLSSLRLKLIDSGLTRFPYTRVESFA